MNLSAARPSISKSISGIRVRSGAVYGIIIILAMLAFESFNYSTTAYALKDLLGNLKFGNFAWFTLLALAFCGIDFAGIARLISPETRKSDVKESWYLFGAWLMAATANAALTWWGVAVAISNHTLKSAALINTDTLTRIIPLFVAILVWVIRILIIGSLSTALQRMTESKTEMPNEIFHTQTYSNVAHSAARSASQPRPAVTVTRNPRTVRPEPTYHSVEGANSQNNPRSSNLF
ncbi:hypothetical protein SDC9_112611 [bioreactor metagenome]|uniref:Uncharacterized protein n=1 Tax=bioreactor metagenome TaxID=1076179 RepID=A0A645BMF3_9ZZZZ